MKQSGRKLDQWFDKDYVISELTWLNIVKPLIMKHIADYVLSQGGTMEKLKETVARKESKKDKAILSCIIYLEQLKEKYLKKDKVSRMILINYGFVRSSK